MKKTILLLALTALAVTPFAVQAGINPATLNLPAVQLITTDNNFYNRSDLVPGARASVMCVACHTRNPSARTFYRQTRNDFTLIGSHWVTSNFADTSAEGGYSDGTAPKVRPATLPGARNYFADNTGTNMTVANGWYGAPKYGYLNGSVIDNTNLRATGTQLICESCHNIVRNIGPAKLLATGFANGGAAQSTLLPGVPALNTPVLCIGCHSDMDAGVNKEWQFHPLTTGTWGGTHHHRNTPGTAVYLGAGAVLAGDSGMQNMTATDYNQVLGGNTFQLWAAGPGQLTGTRALSWTANPARIKPLAGSDNGQIGPRSTNLMCTNCHRAHNAESVAGATILMRGTDTAQIGAGTAPTGASDSWRGTTRMNDRGGRGAAFTNTNPLCMACHR